MKKNELAKKINWEFYENNANLLAIRGLPRGKEYAINEYVDENSFDWGTDEELDGVCAIKVDYYSDQDEQLDEILNKKAMMEKYYGYEKYYLIASTGAFEQGCDEGEVIIQSAYVLAEI